MWLKGLKYFLIGLGIFIVIAITAFFTIIYLYEDEIKECFDIKTTPNKREFIKNKWKNHNGLFKPFEDVFNDISIVKIFSDQATKHGEPGSYINYMKKKDSKRNTKNRFTFKSFFTAYFFRLLSV